MPLGGIAVPAELASLRMERLTADECHGCVGDADIDAVNAATRISGTNDWPFDHRRRGSPRAESASAHTAHLDALHISAVGIPFRRVGARCYK